MRVCKHSPLPNSERTERRMPSFIEQCQCRGNRPAGVIGQHHNLRPDITGNLLRNRAVARFLVAPTGYGKSSCAYEYAHVVFGFEHAFWVRCNSPCFLRDLDDGELFDLIMDVDAEARLVVLDDVPHLDQARTELFDELIGKLLDTGCEVIACCIPSVDTFSCMQMDKILLDGNALLLTDDELEIERMRGNLSRSDVDGMSSSRRAACMVWGEGGATRVLEGIASEELPGDMELLAFSILALGEGSLSDLEGIIRSTRLHEDAAYLASMFPYLGIDVEEGEFRSLAVPVGKIIPTAKLSPATLGRASHSGDRNALAFLLADMLLDRGEGDRASELVMSLAERQAALQWAASRGWRLISECQALSVERLTRARSLGDERMAASLLSLRAWACAMLGDAKGSQSAQRRVLRLSAASWEHIVAAACAGNVMGVGFDPEKALATLERASALREAETFSVSLDDAIERADDALAEDSAISESAFDWNAMLDAELLRLSCDEGYTRLFDYRDDEGPRVRPGGRTDGSTLQKRSSLLASGAWFIEEAARRVKMDGSTKQGTSAFVPSRDETCPKENPIGDVCKVASHLAHELKSAIGEHPISWAECAACNALQTAEETWPYMLDDAIPPGAVARARGAAIALLVQSEQHRKGIEAKDRAASEYQLAHEDPFRANSQPASKVAALRVSTPTLRISMFGGMEVWLGADRTEPVQVRRRNAKVALAILAMIRGHEMTKERLASLVWPDSDMSSSRQNLYVIWAYLKKVLKLGESCPDLVSTQTGYKLDSRFVSSDVEEFEELCRSLMFGRDDRELWEGLYEKVTERFAEDLLPELSGNDFIEDERRRLRTQLVDGLVEASSRMLQEGEMRGATWFAREALRRDRSREDAYSALMEAQIASNQRVAALDTYFECRRFLSEQMGIDPSRRVVELYRSVIESEEEL